jgi:hypothetical protein
MPFVPIAFEALSPSAIESCFAADPNGQSFHSSWYALAATVIFGFRPRRRRQLAIER